MEGTSGLPLETTFKLVANADAGDADAAGAGASAGAGPADAAPGDCKGGNRPTSAQWVCHTPWQSKICVQLHPNRDSAAGWIAGFQMCVHNPEIYWVYTWFMPKD